MGDGNNLPRPSALRIIGENEICSFYNVVQRATGWGNDVVSRNSQPAKSTPEVLERGCSA